MILRLLMFLPYRFLIKQKALKGFWYISKTCLKCQIYFIRKNIDRYKLFVTIHIDMRTFYIAVLTGDLTRPLNRVRIDSIDSLHLHCLNYDSSRECSVITKETNSDGQEVAIDIYFGPIVDFFKKLNKQP